MSLALRQTRRQKFNAFLKARGWEIFFIVGMTASFSTFAFRTLREAGSGVRLPLGELIEGTVERKSAGSREFRKAPMGALLYDLDSIWAPLDSKAKIKLEQDVTLLMNPGSLIVLRRPFKGKGRPKDRVMAVAGKIVVQDGDSGQEDLIEAKSKLFDSIGKPVSEKSATDPSKSEGVSPPPHGVVLVRGQLANVSVPFSWKTSVKGYLVVGAIAEGPGGRGSMNYTSLEAQSEVKLPLAVGRKYEWKVISESGDLVAGPFSFGLEPYVKEEIPKILTRVGDSGKILILME